MIARLGFMAILCCASILRAESATTAPSPAAVVRIEGEIDDFSRERMNLTLKELEEERAMLSDLLR